MGRPRGRKRSRARADRGNDDDAAGEGKEPAHLFPIGAEVEVMRREENGFAGSFYEATVVGYLPSGRPGYVVSYSTLVTTREEDGTSSPLREDVAAADVRPRPPPAARHQRLEFAMNDMVEAFHNQGWRAGVVYCVGRPRQQRVYSVYFPTTLEVLEFDETRLRPHLVFLGQRWVMAAKAVLTKKHMVDENAEFCKVARNGDQHEDNTNDMVQSNTSCVAPIDNLSNMAVATSCDIIPNMFPLSENCEANKVDKGLADCHGNKMVLPSTMLETHYVSTGGPFSAAFLPALKSDIGIIEKGLTKKSAADEHVPHQDHECRPSTDKSALTQVSSADLGNSTESEYGNRLFEPKDIGGTPMSNYVPSRTLGSCHPSLQRSLDVNESILADRHSEFLDADNLPFVKTSPVWAQFEAMEIFHRMPQRPNFHQFQRYGPELREGLALGLMFSFTILAESIKQLNCEDDSSLFEEKMKGISSLEAHGFDVRYLRSYLETLCHMKKKKLEEKITHKEAVDQQLGAQIGILNSTLCELDLQAYLLRCTRQSFISQKVNYAVEISRLKAEVSELINLNLSAEERSADAIAAPW